MSSFIKQLDSLQPDQFATDVEHFAAKEAARRLLQRLETPFEQGWRLSLETPVLIVGVQTILDLGIWEKWTEANKEKPGAPVTLDQLLAWANAKAELNLLRRYLRHLAALYVLEEADVYTWRPTPYSLSLGDTVSHTDQVTQCGTDHIIPTGINLPRFHKKYNYQEPIDLAKLDNYRDMTNGTDFFATCAADPVGKGSSFIGLMAAIRNHKMSWTDVYDTSQIVNGANLSSGAALFVNIGGAHGLDTERLLANHPELPKGVLIPQDTPEVVSMTIENLSPKIMKQAYDLFTPQPQLHARCYFFHAVPHDWPDADCVRMFQQVKTALKPGYSKLLIYEVVLPKKGAMNMMTTLDLLLMNCTSGMERTEEHWGKLLGEAGFRIVRIVGHQRAVESVIEADLA